MSNPHGIIVFGANGSGKTTLGRELARILNFKHMDTEDYCFRESTIPYADARPRDEVISLMLADIEKYRSFVFSTVKGDSWGDVIPKFYKLAVYLSAPYDLRMERIKRRIYEKHGTRVLKGGDMYEQELKFFDFVANRSLTPIDQWAETLTCPVICIDGTEDWSVSAEKVAKQYKNMMRGTPKT